MGKPDGDSVDQPFPGLDIDGSNWPIVPPGLDYPDQYTLKLMLPDVGSVQVRPIRPSDSPLWLAFFNTLSPRSVYLRFFSILRELPADLLNSLTHIEYENQIALVALQRDIDREMLVGDARVIQTSRGCAEFSVVVKDDLQGKGIGACLLQHCLAIARQRGFHHIYGYVLAENKQMLRLGRRLDFTIKYVNGTTEYELIKDCESPVSLESRPR